MRRTPITFLLLSTGLLILLLSCRQTQPQPVNGTQMALERYRDFFEQVSDSLTANPQQVKAQALQHMADETDSLAWYYYAVIVMKAHFFMFNQDSVVFYYNRGKHFFEQQDNRQELPELNELASEYNNILGNLHTRLGNSDTAAYFFHRAYQQRLKSQHTDAATDILMNLADVCCRQGRYDQGAYWYRRALLLCDSLNQPERETAVYYGLGQVYMALRDFKLCDHYFDLAQERFDQMLPYEQYIYLNNRGNSYYYRKMFPEAMAYFRRCDTLINQHPDLTFERNLCYLNMSDVFLSMGQADSATMYLQRCRPFFEEVGSTPALYYIHTQELALALYRHDLQAARHIFQETETPQGLDPDMLLIRTNYLQRYYETTGNYRMAYLCQSHGNRIADSLRSERIRMRVADATLRYTQDSTYMAQNMLIQKKENEVLLLRQTRTVGFALCIITVLTMVFLYLYTKKKRALLLANNQRTVSSLRLENIRNRLSPHFIFNLLNQEMSACQHDERQTLTPLIKLMRRNLELIEQVCVTLEEELDFVQTYLQLERNTLGEQFQWKIDITPGVDPKTVRLPSMMIQIPVENAVKHALCDKEGKRRLWISITRQDNQHGIFIRITDNGGGYRHESRNKGIGMGLKTIMQTIQILNAKNKEHIDVSVHNIKLPDAETGCEICFFLPDKYDFQL